MPAAQLKSLLTIPSQGGGEVALRDRHLAIASSARLSVWDGDKRIISVEAQYPSPGKPRFAGARVLWGPGFLDLATRNYQIVPAAIPEQLPGGGERAQFYSWSPDGERLIASFTSSAPRQTSRVTLFDGQLGARITDIWNGQTLPPGVGWTGKSALIIGFQNPRAFDHSGKTLAELSLEAGTITSIDARADERRILIVDLNKSATLIDADNWTILDRCQGPWSAGAISPDGALVALLEPWGKIHIFYLQNDRFTFHKLLLGDVNTISLAVSSQEIVTIGGGECHLATINIG